MNIGEIIGHGRTADVYEYDNDKILKLFHKNFPRNYIQYEYDVSKYLQEKLPFIPKVYSIIEYQERQGIVYEKIEGITLLEYFFNNPLKLFKEMKNFAKLHVDMHACKFTRKQTQKEFIEHEINRTKELDEKTKIQIIERLEELPTADSLCHRDFHPDNVFYTSKGLIVIDWVTATVGAPAGDVARTYFILRHAKPTRKISIIEKIKIKLFQAIISKQYIKNYLKNSNLTRNEIKKWELVTIAGRLAEGIPNERAYILKRIRKLLKKKY